MRRDTAAEGSAAARLGARGVGEGNAGGLGLGARAHAMDALRFLGGVRPAAPPQPPSADEGDGEVFDRASFSRLLRKVSIEDAKEYSRMSYLCNIAYMIPKIQVRSLLAAVPVTYMHVPCLTITAAVNPAPHDT